MQWNDLLQVIQTGTDLRFNPSWLSLPVPTDQAWQQRPSVTEADTESQGHGGCSPPFHIPSWEEAWDQSEHPPNHTTGPLGRDESLMNVTKNQPSYLLWLPWQSTIDPNLNSKHLLLTVLDTGRPKIKVPVPGLQTSTSHRGLSWPFLRCAGTEGGRAPRPNLNQSPPKDCAQHHHPGRQACSVWVWAAPACSSSSGSCSAPTRASNDHVSQTGAPDTLESFFHPRNWRNHPNRTFLIKA